MLHCLPASSVPQGPIGQEYGKYGIIRETDMYSKRPEFQLWAIEVGRERVWGWGASGWCDVHVKEENMAAIPHASSATVATPPDTSTRSCCSHVCMAPALQVKNVDIEAMPRSEEKEMFKDYMEEYNTATLPHKWVLGVLECGGVLGWVGDPDGLSCPTTIPT